MIYLNNEIMDLSAIFKCGEEPFALIIKNNN